MTKTTIPTEDYYLVSPATNSDGFFSLWLWANEEPHKVQDGLYVGKNSDHWVAINEGKYRNPHVNVEDVLLLYGDESPATVINQYRKQSPVFASIQTHN